MDKILIMPDVVNPVRPPNAPIKLPPIVVAIMNSIALIIVPNVPARAAFHKPPRAPSWAIYPVMKPTINNPIKS